MKKSVKVGSILVVIIIGGWILYQRVADQNRVITPSETQQLMAADTNHLILDVRTEQEFTSETGHIKGAVLIPVQELQARMSELQPFRKQLIIAVCRSGNRSGFATALLQSEGFQARNMVGGMLRWNAEGRPVEQGMSQ